MAKTYLLSRTLDPILGIFTGLLAFHLNETNPRSAPAPGHTLSELIAWKWNENKEMRYARDQEDDNEWERVTREFGVTQEDKK
ncbi:uncharacterized protein I206_106850 [Kwoniella pini CBS 10737]|uniref:Uncharacterized protein n=1 Tax=Kwoniella pini CBS 10737 TaxID=1296096 RepID=A0A1B9HZV8_9TREE|nr:uncharacterized protein I206_05604 [Kwoniella pini CBS 10737]OCF48823.1 hypothetical protein I206_05604 [Kwoniella pini CBS 10737]